MKYYKYYKAVRTRNPLIRAIHALRYIRHLDSAGNLRDAFNETLI